MKPIINPNGSAPDTLLDGIVEARQALMNLEGALRKLAPHGRDYQLNPAPDLPADRAEWEEQFPNLRPVDLWLTSYAEHLWNEKDRTGR